MNHVVIKRPKIEDMKELHHFFRVVIIDTFAKEGITEHVEDMQEEIETKKNYLKRDFESNGADRYFLIAIQENKIIGSIEYGPASQLINDCTNGELKGFMEVGTVFVHPDYQRNGIGNILLNNIFEVLRGKDIKEFCLDSGYKNSQIIWHKKFGEPDYFLKDYWGEGNHHVIWRIDIRGCN